MSRLNEQVEWVSCISTAIYQEVNVPEFSLKSRTLSLNASRLAYEMPTWELASRLTSSLSQTRT